MGKLTFAYWDIRGLAEPARMMLEYGGIDYEDKRYKCGEVPPYDRSNWLDVKFTLGLDFPNLPYLIDGDVKITESLAIYRYIARRSGLNPSTEKEMHECDMLEGVVNGLRSNFTSTCYNPNFGDLKAKLREDQPVKLGQFEKFLNGRKWLAGEKITFVDFSFFETLDHHRILFPDILDKFPNITAFMKRFESLDRISTYFKSDRYKKLPINNPSSNWGNQKQ